MRRAMGAIIRYGRKAKWIEPTDRFVPTTATAGANAWLGNHPGASGGPAIPHLAGRVYSETQTEYGNTSAGLCW